MALVTAFRIELDDNLVLLSGDFGITSAAADAAYLRLDGTNDPLTGAITFADVAGSINSGNYSLQFESGIADGASAVGYKYDTTNILDTAGSTVYEWRTGGAGLFQVRYEPTGGFAGFGKVIFDTSILKAGSEIVGALQFTTPGTFGQVLFANPGSSAGVGMNPGAFSFFTSAAPITGATIVFAADSGATDLFTMERNSSTTLNAFWPSADSEANPATLGKNTGNTKNAKWDGAYFADNAPIWFGNNADVLIDFDSASSNLIIDAGTNGIRIGTSAAETLGFHDATPSAQSAPYTVTNPTADRAFDVSSTTLNELAAVVGTMITDLQTKGLFG